MGLFGKGKKKEPKLCDLCGQEISGFAFPVADGRICDDCRERINKVMPVEQWSELTVAQVRENIEGISSADQTECSVCGRPFGESYPTEVADGKICSECTRLLRGTYFHRTVIIDPDNSEDREKYADEIRRIEHEQSIGKISLTDRWSITEDELSDMQTEWLAEDIQTRKEQIEKAVSDYGSEYRNIYHVGDSFVYDLNVLEGGIHNAKEFKGKLVVNGEVAAGSFSSGDSAVLIHEGEKKDVTVLKAVPCLGCDFDIEISTSMGNQTVSADDNAWLVLDIDYMPLEVNDIIAGK